MDAPGPGVLDGLDPGDFEQMIIGGALLAIEQDLVRAHDLAEFPPRIGITGVKVGMSSLGRLTKGGPQSLGVVARQRTEQIVERLHARPAGLPFITFESAAANS